MKNKRTNVRILATALISVVVFLLNAGVVGAADAPDYENDTTYKKCVEDAEKTFNDANTKCQTDKTSATTKCDNTARDSSISKCDNFEPGTTERDNCEKTNNISQTLIACKSTAELDYQKCLLDNELQNTNILDKCINDAISRADCGNGTVDYGEECDDKEGKKSEDEDRYIDPVKNRTYDGCFRCEKQDVFRVSDWLKINEGQTYLEKAPKDSTKTTYLKNGLIYFIITGIEIATKIIGSLALLMIIVAGIIMMISSGNSQLQQKGKRMILYAILGLAVALLSLVIVTSIQSLFYTT